MKSLKQIFFMLLFSFITVGFCACGDDDKENEPAPEAGQELVEGKWVEQGNQLIYKVTYSYGGYFSYTAVWTLTFDGDTCVKSECACTFDSNEIADAFYQGFVEDGDYPVTKSGNTVTIDYTEFHQGMSKSELKASIAASGGF